MVVKSREESIQGRFYKINKKINKNIKAKYHRIKDWVMDPRGYFLIDIDRKKKLLRVGYCKFTKLGNKPINDMASIVSGKTAIEIVNTLIKNEYILNGILVLTLLYKVQCPCLQNAVNWIYNSLLLKY